MELDQVRIADIDEWGGETFGSIEYLPQFINYPAQVAWDNGWVCSVREYQSFAALIFAYRFPSHPYSRFVRGLKPDITDAMILDLATGTSGC